MGGVRVSSLLASYLSLQPALLYIVPACIATSAAGAMAKGKFADLWAYTGACHTGTTAFLTLYSYGMVTRVWLQECGSL